MNHEEHEDREEHEDDELILSLRYVASGFSRTGTTQHRRLMSREAPICIAEKRSQSPDDERLMDGQVTIDRHRRKDMNHEEHEDREEHEDDELISFT